MDTSALATSTAPVIKVPPTSTAPNALFKSPAVGNVIIVRVLRHRREVETGDVLLLGAVHRTAKLSTQLGPIRAARIT